MGIVEHERVRVDVDCVGINCNALRLDERSAVFHCAVYRVGRIKRDGVRVECGVNDAPLELEV